MDNIDVLLEAHKAIRTKINKALHGLEKWFKDKIEWAKKQLSKIAKKFKKAPPEEPKKKKGIASARPTPEPTFFLSLSV